MVGAQGEPTDIKVRATKFGRVSMSAFGTTAAESGPGFGAMPQRRFLASTHVPRHSAP